MKGPKVVLTLTAALALAGLVACKSEKNETVAVPAAPAATEAAATTPPPIATNPSPPGAGQTADVTRQSQDPKVSGTVRFTSEAAGVHVVADVKGVKPGQHGFHLHEKGDCSAPGYKSAGGHFNPEHKQHGADNPQGPHAGDMPNFTVDAKGGSTASVVAPGVTLDDGPHSVFTGGGTALVIHEKADDGKTDPAGAAGNRIACGLIKK